MSQAKYYVWKRCILLVGTGIWKISSVACGFSSVKNLLFCQQNKWSLGFSIKYRYSDILLKNYKYNCLFSCNRTCYCIGMVSVMSASSYVRSASCYQGRPSVYIQGLIPQIGSGSSDCCETQSSCTVKLVLSGHSKKKTLIGFQGQLSLNEGQKYCWMIQGKHSAILLTFI